MPICEISYAKGLLPQREQDEIVERVTGLLLKAEGLSDNPISRSICLVDLYEAEKMCLGGRISDTGKIVVKIYAFSDAYSNATKESLHSEITKIFIEENKVTNELKGNNIWCIIIPLQSFDFGVGGKPVTLELTRKIVNRNGAGT